MSGVPGSVRRSIEHSLGTGEEEMFSKRLLRKHQMDSGDTGDGGRKEEEGGRKEEDTGNPFNGRIKCTCSIGWRFCPTPEGHGMEE